MNKLKKSLGPALAHSGLTIVYFLFIVPFDAFVNAVERLAKQRQNKALKLSEINTPWPFFSFLKRVFLDFSFDFLTVLCYLLAPLIFIIVLASGGGFLGALAILVGCYYAPLFIAWLRDFTVMILMPIRKFISWCYKPAQYLDLNVTKNKAQIMGMDQSNGEEATPKAEAPAPAAKAPAAQAPVAQAPVAEVPSYYVYINNQQQGPFTSAQIGNMIASRTIDMNAQVWKQGMAEWMPINKVADLKKLFK